MDRRALREGMLLHDVFSVLRVYHKLERRQDGPDRGTRAVAILIWFLNRNPDLAVLYLLKWSVALIESTDFCRDTAIAALTMLDWFRDTAIRGVVMAAITSLEHPCRYQADSFLMQSCLVDFIVAQNQRGLTVDLPQALQVYLHLWSHRAMSDRTARCLRRLAWHRKLSTTTLPPARELNREQLVTRLIYENTP